MGNQEKRCYMIYEIKVENIKCNGCAHSIKTALLNLKGVDKTEVNIDLGSVLVETTGEITREDIVKKLQGLGYPEPGHGSGMTTATSYISCMIGRVKS